MVITTFWWYIILMRKPKISLKPLLDSMINTFISMRVKVTTLKEKRHSMQCRQAEDTKSNLPSPSAASKEKNIQSPFSLVAHPQKEPLQHANM